MQVNTKIQITCTFPLGRVEAEKEDFYGNFQPLFTIKWIIFYPETMGAFLSAVVDH